MLGVVWLLVAAGELSAQLIAVDDTYSVPFGASLQVESPGVLGNDTYNNEPAADADATAEVIDYVSFGFLTCESDPDFDICPDGSFTYTPDPDLFQGTDTFTYQAVRPEVTVATHIAAGSGRDVPDYASAIDVLAEVGALPRSFAGSFRDVAGFRNILVHGYLEIDIEILHRTLNSRLQEFAEYAGYIEDFLKRR